MPDDFKSRVDTMSPQVGHVVPFRGQRACLNRKGCYELDAERRLEG